MDLQGVSTIYCLPDEVLAIILQNNSPRDILNFGATCKQFNEIVKGHISLWKHACATTFPPVLYEVIEEYHNSNWLHEMKYYSTLKHELHSELIAMSEKHYWKISERSLDNVDNFFSILKKTNFFYALYILQDVIKKGTKVTDEYECILPYTLTEMYYSKAVLRHFVHTFLSVKWAKAKLEQLLPPEFVINFFIQWIDPANLYLDEDVQKKVKIDLLADQVNKILEKERNASKQQCSDIQIIQAVTYVIYKQKRMVLTTATDLATLDISKVLQNRCGSVIVVAAIYQAVATRCGACCELIVFPNHLYLEWKDLSSPGNQLYNIDLGTGDIYPKRMCPFSRSHNTTPTKYSYCPDSLLQYMYSSFLITMGALRTWNTQNAMYLLDFLGTENEHSSLKNSNYKKYLPYLMENSGALRQCDKLNVKQLSNEHIRFITSLSDLGEHEEVPTRKKVPKKHAANVKFAVGMICYHKRYDYVCIVRGWDVTGSQLHFPLDDLYFGRNQPFYYITAADQSERYVAQENLMELTRPTRLYHLEHQISRDFTHFDGFAYALNEQKKMEYPDDQPIVEVFRALCQQKPSNM